MTTNQKRGVVICAIGLGIGLISLIIPAKGIDSQNRIARAEFGEGEIEIPLVAQGEDKTAELFYTVRERQYSKEELNEMLPDFKEILEKEILGENESFDKVSENLNFVSEIKGYPFYVSWSSKPVGYINSQGEIKEEIGQTVSAIITAEAEYGEFRVMYSFPVVLVPKELTEAEEWIQVVQKTLQKADESSLEKEYITLPTETEGREIRWTTKKDTKGFWIAALTVIVGLVFFRMDVVKEREKEKLRQQEIARDYPEFALKCAMLIGSGLTVRQTFEKIGRIYSISEKKRALYEEVLVGVRELQSGVPERKVYENFGHRCRVRQLERFGSLMSRNLRKGTDGLKNALRGEAREAMEMHREQIRQKGERAGTKLLFPMMIMLLIVMVMVMYPALGNFNI